MKEESPNPRIDPKLEARIVALVLGEASDFERDELNRLINEQPELAAFKEQIESVHGKLLHVATGESIPEEEQWKLPGDKRDAVLATIRGEEQPPTPPLQPAKQVIDNPAETGRPMRRSLLWNLSMVAAALCVVAMLGIMAIPSLQDARFAVSARVASTEEADSYAMDNATPPPTDEVASSAGADFAEDMAPAEEESQPPAANVEYDESPPPALTGVSDGFDIETTAEPEGEALAVPEPVVPRLEVGNAPGGAERQGITVGMSAPGITAGVPGPASRDTATEGPVTGRPVTGGDVDWSDGTERDPAARWALGVELSAPHRAEAPGDPSIDISGAALPGSDLSVSAGERPNSYQLEIGKKTLDVADKGLAAPDSPAGVTLEERLESPAMNALTDSRSYTSDYGGRPTGDETFSRVRDGKRKTSVASGQPTNSGDSDQPFGFSGNESAISLPSPTNDPTDSSEDLKGMRGDGSYNGNGTVDVLAKEDGLVSGSGEKSVIVHGISPSFSIAPRRGESKPGSGPTPSFETEESDTEGAEGKIANDSRKRLSQLGLALPTELYKSSNVDGIVPRYDSNARIFAGSEWQQPLSPQMREPKMQAGGFSVSRFFTKRKSDVESRTIVAGRKPTPPAGLNEKNAADEAFSTFSLHVSDVSFKLARAALASGQWPEAAKVRIEEFVNAFDYGDPMPSQGEKVACQLEQSIHPFLQQRNLLRVSMRTAAAGRASNTPLRLVLLLDNSGSMERIDRRQTVRRAFALLAQQLKPIDQVSLISFASRPRLLADKVSGSQARRLVQLIDQLPSEGGTNIEAALQLAFEKASEQRVENAQNRIILLTDGAVNLGDANPESLSRMVTTMRDAGIAFDAAGISAEGLNDEVLEALTRQGDGRYYLLDSPEAADDGFARQIAGALRPSAKNVKVQIEFNPKRVGRYKLLGFEKHRLKKEDFRNDKIDAAEMAAAEAGVALYQFEAKPDGEGDVGSVSVRFRDLSTGRMVENRWPIPYEAAAPRPDQAAPSLRIATSAAMLAAKLRGEPLGEAVDLKTLSNLISGLPDRERNANRVQQLQQMIQQARQVSGN